MKKFFVNFLVFLLALLILEGIALIINLNKYDIALNAHSNWTLKDYYSARNFYYNESNIGINGKDSTLPPVVLFGCSYTEGFGLRENETLSARLSDYTNRTVYNNGFSGSGLSLIEMILSSEEVVKALPPNAEYIIYTFINDHIRRMYTYRSWSFAQEMFPRYVKRNDGIELKYPSPSLNWLYRTFIHRTIEEYIAIYRACNSQTDEYFFRRIIKRIDDKIKNNFKQAKFVILYYDVPGYYEIIENSIKELNLNIILLNVYDFIPNIDDEKYWQEDGHPSAEAWEVIVPKLVEKLKMND